MRVLHGIATSTQEPPHYAFVKDWETYWGVESLTNDNVPTHQTNVFHKITVAEVKNENKRTGVRQRRDGDGLPIPAALKTESVLKSMVDLVGGTMKKGLPYECWKRLKNDKYS